MAKKKANETKTRKDRRPVDLDLDLVPRIATIAGALGMSVPTYVNNRLRLAVQADLPRVIEILGLGSTNPPEKK